MSAIFPKWTNWLPLGLLAVAGVLGGLVTPAVVVYDTPKNTLVGYEPVQPVPFSHKIHAGQMGLDCRYCHNGVEKSWFSNLPGASTCMNCHNQVMKDDPLLAVVRDSAATGKPIAWVQVHKLPDYAYFNHSVHVDRGISCVECHGRVDQMDEVYHAKPFSMSFCLDCHRDPAAHIRPVNQVTHLGWQWSTNETENAALQSKNGTQFVHDWKVESLTSCSACHR